jgi:hypothetical protein
MSLADFNDFATRQSFGDQSNGDDNGAGKSSQG